MKFIPVFDSMNQPVCLAGYVLAGWWWDTRWSWQRMGKGL